MKITEKILSIPPYLSTTWKNIGSLSLKGVGEWIVIVTLQNGLQVEIPHLDREAIDAIFEAHAKYAGEGASLNPPYTLTLPLKGDGMGSFELFSSSMQHNPEQSHLEPLPPELL